MGDEVRFAFLRVVFRRNISLIIYMRNLFKQGGFAPFGTPSNILNVALEQGGHFPTGRPPGTSAKCAFRTHSRPAPSVS